LCLFAGQYAFTASAAAAPAAAASWLKAVLVQAPTTDGGPREAEVFRSLFILVAQTALDMRSASLLSLLALQ
jgi:hypothetical protein